MSRQLTSGVLGRKRVFTPSDIPGLVLWIDVQSYPLGSLATITDKSNGHIFTPFSIANPLSIIKEGNAKFISFDGSNHYLNQTTAIDIFRNVSGITYYSYSKFNTISGASKYLFGANTPGVNNNQIVRFGLRSNNNNIDLLGRRLDNDSLQTVGYSGNTNKNIFRVVVDYQNSDVFLFQNNVLMVSSLSFQTNGNTSDTSSNKISIGGFGTNLDFIGLMGETIIYNRTLSEVENSFIQNYYQNKYNI